MSRSSRSCLFSRRSRANSSRSAAARPGFVSSRRPSCLSAAATHAPINCAVGSNSRARSSGDRPARTRSTIWRRNSDEYGGRVLAIRNTSDESFRVSTKAGQSHLGDAPRSDPAIEPKTDDAPAALTDPAPAASWATAASPLFSMSYDEFLAKDTRMLVEKTRTQSRAVRDRFISIVGDLPTLDMDQSVIGTFKLALRRAPVMNGKSIYLGKPLDEAIAMADRIAAAPARGDGTMRIAGKTLPAGPVLAFRSIRPPSSAATADRPPPVSASLTYLRRIASRW